MSRRQFPDINVQTAIVTGAASGIDGREIERLRAAGVRVVGGDANPKITELRADDPGFIGCQGDVTDPAYAHTLVATAEDHFGPVDLLFHSAGIMPGGALAEHDVDDILRVMSVNDEGTVRTVKAVLPGMRSRGRGQIVVLGSLTGYVPTRSFGAYSATKSAVNTFVETLSHEEDTHGIQVLLAAPIAVKTPLLEQASAGPRFLRKLAQSDSSPLMVTTDDVLDSIDAGLARGTRIVVPGGRLVLAVRRLSPALAWRAVSLFGA